MEQRSFSQSRTLATILFGIAAVLGVLWIAWMLTAAATGTLRAGGFALGLVIAAVLLLPVVGAGWYLWQYAGAEQAAQALFERARLAAEREQAFRQELATTLRRYAVRLRGMLTRANENATARMLRYAGSLEQAAEELEHAGIFLMRRLELGGLTSEDLETLDRYGDLVRQQLRSVDLALDRLEERGSAPENVNTLGRALEQLEYTLRQRHELLVRGRRVPAAAPLALLERHAAAADYAAVAALRLGDAVTYEGEDYLVRAILHYVSSTARWTVFLLSSTEERWLLVDAARALLAVLRLEPGEAPEPDALSVRLDGSTLQLADSGVAQVEVEVAGAPRSSAIIQYWSYVEQERGRRMAWLEQWPPEAAPLGGMTRRFYTGRREDPGVLDLWTRGA
jgi:hypothetical protein